MRQNIFKPADQICDWLTFTTKMSMDVPAVCLVIKIGAQLLVTTGRARTKPVDYTPKDASARARRMDGLMGGFTIYEHIPCIYHRFVVWRLSRFWWCIRRLCGRGNDNESITNRSHNGDKRGKGADHLYLTDLVTNPHAVVGDGSHFLFVSWGVDGDITSCCGCIQFGTAML